MSKTLLFLSVITICSTSLLSGQNPVPNPGFENWASFNPDDWQSYNVTQTSGHSGLNGARGEVISGAIPMLLSLNSNNQPFPVSQQYSTFSFYYKTNLTGTTKFHAFFQLYDSNGGVVGGLVVKYTGIISTWTLANIPVNSPASAVTCYVGFTMGDSVASPTNGNYFIVDDILLSGTTGVHEQYIAGYAIEKIQPNPVKQLTTVYYSLTNASELSFQLTDMTGRKQKEFIFENEQPGRHKIELNVSGIASGYYMLQMISGEGIRTARLAVVH